MAFSPVTNYLNAMMMFLSTVKSKDPTAAKTGKERRGSTYAALFKGLERDPGHERV